MCRLLELVSRPRKHALGGAKNGVLKQLQVRLRFAIPILSIPFTQVAIADGTDAQWKNTTSSQQMEPATDNDSDSEALRVFSFTTFRGRVDEELTLTRLQSILENWTASMANDERSFADIQWRWTSDLSGIYRWSASDKFAIQFTQRDRDPAIELRECDSFDRWPRGTTVAGGGPGFRWIGGAGYKLWIRSIGEPADPYFETELRFAKQIAEFSTDPIGAMRQEIKDAGGQPAGPLECIHAEEGIMRWCSHSDTNTPLIQHIVIWIPSDGDGGHYRPLRWLRATIGAGSTTVILSEQLECGHCLGPPADDPVAIFAVHRHVSSLRITPIDCSNPELMKTLNNGMAAAGNPLDLQMPFPVRAMTALIATSVFVLVFGILCSKERSQL